MGAFFIFLLVPVLIILIAILSLFLFAYAKVMQIWNKLKGGSSNTHKYTYRNTQSNQSKTYTSGTKQQSDKRIFAEGEGEYVDFEIVDDKKDNQ